MSGLFWASSTTKFDEDVDRATAETLPTGEEDLELNFEISDSIRSKSVHAREAMRSIKRRINHKNPNVQLSALALTDTCIKNGGDHFLAEIASRDFMDNLVSLLKSPALNNDVKGKILRLIQNWAVSFDGKPSLKYTTETYRILKQEGYSFPPIDPAAMSAAMTDTLTPPEWIDSDVCMRCRTPFSFTNRKHHCRCCGLIFDQQCSSKSMPLPHLGIVQPVRVCDSCHIKVNKAKRQVTLCYQLYLRGSKHPRKLSKSGTTTTRPISESEDEDLQRAIQLSLEEAGLADPGHGPRRVGYIPPEFPGANEPPLVVPNVQDGPDDDPELRAAIEASLWESQAPKASAPTEDEPALYDGAYISPNFDLDPTESEAILAFSQTVESASAQGATDLMQQHGVTELYDRATRMRPKLAQSLDDTGRREQILSEMNEKLSEAARLYDKLLTSQISTSRHFVPQRTEPYPSHPASVPYAPYSASYQPLASPSWKSSPVSHQAHSSEPEAPTFHYNEPQYPQYVPQTQQPELSQQMTQPLAQPTISHAQQHEQHEPTPSYNPSAMASLTQPSELQPSRIPPPPSLSAPISPPHELHIPPPAIPASVPVVLPSQPQPYQSVNSMPIFPSVPTGPLQSQTYRAPEPKEAMLISFD
ncbi:uncharacterized protein EI90DRAFT_3145793 [Cantharellus anzutake]|uniref:uncharacterized protein n=1 Tax=Cantharellus anzutake TaxID=1750568 RepID=UPI0019084E92|nr:uncharacterized protein EI90DRAFT_3145793 [Cantharellus anzutake]KAF8330445.1 hypothetical protein EI90DRAFT_3145793 [Cantharellus anzutake]